jgi:hypothetical protein
MINRIVQRGIAAPVAGPGVSWELPLGMLLPPKNWLRDKQNKNITARLNDLLRLTERSA